MYYIFLIIIPLLCMSKLLNKEQRNYLHMFITFYIAFGGILSNSFLITKIHFYILCLIMIHWLLNNNRCFLSDIDYSENVESNTYSIKILKIITGIEFNSDIAEFISWLTLIIPGIIDLFLLYKYYINACKKNVS